MIENVPPPLDTLPALVGFLLFGSLPIITLVAAAGSVRAAWQHRRDRAALLGGIALIGFAATMWWTTVMSA